MNTETEKTRRSLKRLAWLLDSSIPLPGGFRVGLDGIIGLIPGIGDLATASVSTYIIAKAAAMKVPASILARMGLNVLLELVIGVVPFFGDLFDIVFRANVRNVALMEAHLDNPGRTKHQSRWVVVGTVLGMALVFVAAIALVIGVIRLLWRLVGG